MYLLVHQKKSFAKTVYTYECWRNLIVYVLITTIWKVKMSDFLLFNEMKIWYEVLVLYWSIKKYIIKNVKLHTRQGQGAMNDLGDAKGRG